MYIVTMNRKGASRIISTATNLKLLDWQLRTLEKTNLLDTYESSKLPNYRELTIMFKGRATVPKVEQTINWLKGVGGAVNITLTFVSGNEYLGFEL